MHKKSFLRKPLWKDATERAILLPMAFALPRSEDAASLPRRTGPRPLSVHVGMAACAWGLPLEPGIGGSPPEAAQGMSAQMLRMLAGIRKYHEHPYRRPPASQAVSWAEGSMRLLHTPASADRKGSLFLIPSLINGADILDLLPERSFVNWLAAKGFESFLLDWGDLAADEAAQAFDPLFVRRILPAFRAAQAAAGQGRLSVLGYCMGGILAAGLATLAPQNVCSLTLLATPWDFHAGDQSLATRVRLWAPGGRSMAESLGRLPVDWLQILFASVDPLMAAHKFVRFADFPDDSAAARIFVAVEDWLNGGSDLPAGIAQTCLQDWYTDNATASAGWRVCGQSVDSARLSVPVLVVASAADRLVPRESAMAFQAGRPPAFCENFAPPCGHIGMVAGRDCVAQVWEPIATWMERHGQ